MKKLGIFVGERGLWTFFKEIYSDFTVHYETTVFEPAQYRLPILSGRVNDWTYRNGILTILRKSDACFFEWASEMLEVASHMPKHAPIVTRLHSFELAEWAHRINWDHVDRIIFVSEAIRVKFIAKYPAHASKTVLVYNAIPVNNYTPVWRPFTFSLGMLCAIHPIKRVYETILMVKELREQGYRPTLHIAGGPVQGNDQDRYYQAVRGLVKKLALEEAVQFYGHVDEPAAWLQKIDIFISNSFWEGLQTALIEAMASGCYCLSHFWDGAEEVLPPENIYITDSELMHKIIFYAQLSEDERAHQKSQMVEIAVQKFDIEDKKPRLREIIESVQ
jgi:glycosyltransferase involved in cell wall biosynthesis